jgi:branched-chain amino acid transport system ATP-binding protein
MSEWLLQARGLSKEFAGFRAVSNVDLNIRAGTIHVLIGPNGAGKTTLFNLLTKFIKPSAGQITFDGADVTNDSPARLARAGMVRSFQISSTFGSMSVLENVRGALQRCHGESSYAFWRSDRALAALDDAALSLLGQVGLEAQRDIPARELPYGAKRALELATTMALEPKLMLLDEPTAGIARDEIPRITALIKSAAKGRTVLMVEHNLRVVKEISDHITVLNRGSVLTDGDYATVSHNAQVIEAYLGGEDDGDEL